MDRERPKSIANRLRDSRLQIAASVGLVTMAVLSGCGEKSSSGNTSQGSQGSEPALERSKPNPGSAENPNTNSGSQAKQESQQNTQKGREIPNFTLYRASGGGGEESMYNGRPVIIYNYIKNSSYNPAVFEQLKIIKYDLSGVQVVALGLGAENTKGVPDSIPVFYVDEKTETTVFGGPNGSDTNRGIYFVGPGGNLVAEMSDQNFDVDVFRQNLEKAKNAPATSVPPVESSAPKEVKGHGLNREISDFSLPDVSGTLHNLSSYRGKNVIIYWFGYTWDPTTKELDSVTRLIPNYGDNLQVITLANDKFEAKRIQGKGGQVLVFNVDNEFVKKNLMFQGIPDMAFIDKDGKLVAEKSSIIDYDNLVRMTDALVAGNDVISAYVDPSTAK